MFGHDHTKMGGNLSWLKSGKSVDNIWICTLNV